MIAAGQEEKRLAILNGDVDKDGCPLITVVADGSWAKWSYKSGFSSSSGAECIVRLQTKKVLFLGVRNSYCCICARNAKLNIDVPEHKYYKNWRDSANAIDADIIAEGFAKIMQMHGVKYNKLVGGGDSSIMKKLFFKKPYGPDFIITKIECKNNLLRNFCNKINALEKETINHKGFVPVDLRRKVASNVLRLRKAVVGAINYRKLQDGTNYGNKINNLKMDIKNFANHVAALLAKEQDPGVRDARLNARFPQRVWSYVQDCRVLQVAAVDEAAASRCDIRSLALKTKLLDNLRTYGYTFPTGVTWSVPLRGPIPFENATRNVVDGWDYRVAAITPQVLDYYIRAGDFCGVPVGGIRCGLTDSDVALVCLEYSHGLIPALRVLQIVNATPHPLLARTEWFATNDREEPDVLKVMGFLRNEGLITIRGRTRRILLLVSAPQSVIRVGGVDIRLIGVGPRGEVPLIASVDARDLLVRCLDTQVREGRRRLMCGLAETKGWHGYRRLSRLSGFAQRGYRLHALINSTARARAMRSSSTHPTLLLLLTKP
ncbi:hypothetical protein ACJJTC_011274 [Scirpophaga incertulas]